jgi:signal transduction histidine kinase
VAQGTDSAVHLDFMRNLLKRIDLLVHSIRLRLALWFVFILGLVLVSFSALVYISRVRELQAEAVNRLGTRLEEIEKIFNDVNNPGFDTNQGGKLTLLRQEDVVALYDSGLILQRIWGPFAELPPINLPVHIANDENGRAFRFVSLTNGEYHVDYAFLIAPFSSNGNLSGYILIGMPLDPMGQRGSLLVTLLTLVSIMLVVALAGGFWLADRAMRPVKVITYTAQQISETDLSQRFNLNKKDEIGQLADTFDAMLARLESAFMRQRQFTADASHELRTPLTIVNLETDRALSAARTPHEYQRALQVIRSENDLMSHLVNDLLTLARMDAGRESLQKERLDLSDLALEVIERLESMAAGQKVVLVAEDLPEVSLLGDRKALIQMLTNLVENAIKYTSQNDVDHDRRVVLSTGTDPQGIHGWVRVQDTGPGIPAEHLDHLFDRFYRVDKSRARAEEPESTPAGSGLGLAIVESIARSHGGSIRVTSELGQGTIFEILLPCAARG